MTDHKEQAFALLESIHLDTSDVYDQSDSARDLRLKLAQIHATLHLAAQQRLANEIEFVKFAVSENSTITDQDGLQKLANRVVEGLDI